MSRESARDKRLSRHPDVFYPWQAEQLLGVGRQTLHYWNKSGLYRPRVPRMQLRYDLVDMCILSCFVLIKKHGVSTRRLRESYAHQVRSSVLSALDGGANVEDLVFALLRGWHAWIGVCPDTPPGPAVETLYFEHLTEQLVKSKKLLTKSGTPTREL